MDKKNKEAEMSVGEHINELRNRLLKCVIALFIFAIVAFIFKDIILNIVFGPTMPDFFTNRVMCELADMLDSPMLCINQNSTMFVNTKMAGQFNMHVKTAFISALVLTVPFILFQLWAFIKPALALNVQKQCKNIVLQISVWFFIGLCFGYYAIAPLAVNFLTNYEVSTEITNMIEVSSYLGTVMGVSFAAALVFQLPLTIKLLSSIGIMQSGLMIKYRKYAFAVIIIFAAIITPPDIFSQILVAIPLYILYEYGIVIARRIEKRKREELEQREVE